MFLDTDRLMLRQIRRSDFNDLYRMNSDPVIMQYIGNGSTRNREQMLDELDALVSYYNKRPGMGVWIVSLRSSGEFIGAAGLTYNADKAEPELGYRLIKEHWNNGYATELSTKLLQYAFETLKVSKVIASAHIENVASRNVLKKVGMSRTKNGSKSDSPHIYYEIALEDYF